MLVITLGNADEITNVTAVNNTEFCFGNSSDKRFQLITLSASISAPGNVNNITDREIGNSECFELDFSSESCIIVKITVEAHLNHGLMRARQHYFSHHGTIKRMSKIVSNAWKTSSTL